MKTKMTLFFFVIGFGLLWYYVGSSNLHETIRQTHLFHEETQKFISQTANIVVEHFPERPRSIIGLPAGKQIEEIPFENEPSKDWKDKLSAQLVGLGQDKIKVDSIESRQSYIQIHQGKARYLESVVIRLSKENGDFSSFQAEVDSGSGQILKTWNQPIYENFRNPHRKESKVIVEEKDGFRPL
jgi:hypothetical protein